MRIVTTTPRRRRTARQDALLDQLVELMAAEGFAVFTLDDLAERLRCSKTTLYQLAGSKQELVVEVVKQYFRAATLAVEARVASAGDPRGRVDAYLRGVAEHLQPLSRAFMADLQAFAPASEVYRRNTEAAAERIRALIAEGIESRAFRPIHPAFMGEMVAATMFGIQSGQLSERLGMTDSDAYAELAATVVSSLASP